MLTLIFIVLAHCDGKMALLACVRSSDTEISALIIRARNHGFHHWTGWAASACQVGVHVSLGSAHTPLALLSRQPQLRPGETQRELCSVATRGWAGRLQTLRALEGSLNRPPATSRSCLGYLELLHHTRDRLTFLSMDSGQCKRTAMVGIFKSSVDAGRRLEKAARV